MVLARESLQLRESARMLRALNPDAADAAQDLAIQRAQSMDGRAREVLENWPAVREAYSGDEHVTRVRDRDIRTALKIQTLSGTALSKMALPQFDDDGADPEVYAQGKSARLFPLHSWRVCIQARW